MRLFVLSLGILLVGPVGAQGDNIVLLEPVRIAFFEQAPRRLERSMRDAVQRYCFRYAGQPSPSSPAVTILPGYCSLSHVLYLRAVDVLGDAYMTGFACEAHSLTPGLKYYLEDMLSDAENCVYVAYDVDSKRHYLSDDE